MYEENNKALIKVERALEGLSDLTTHQEWLLVNTKLMIAKLALDITRAQNQALNRPKPGGQK